MTRYEIFVLDYVIKQQNQNGILWWYPNGIIGCFSPTVKGEKSWEMHPCLSVFCSLAVLMQPKTTAEGLE